MWAPQPLLKNYSTLTTEFTRSTFISCRLEQLIYKEKAMSNSIEIFTAVFKDPISAENAYNLALQKGHKADESISLCLKKLRQRITEVG